MAVEQDPSARDAFLAEACAGDEALRCEVESLLRQDASSVVLDRSVWATAASLFQTAIRSWLLVPDLGPYRIEGPLGAGGMGEVFRATDTRLNRPVAIKVLPTGVALDEQMRARFAREARAVAALTHPHICTLYDVGCHDEIDFLVMEYLEGDTLAARLTQGRLSLDEALDVRDRDRQRARPRASPRDCPSRSEARQHHVDRKRREAARFRRREVPAAVESRASHGVDLTTDARRPARTAAGNLSSSRVTMRP